MKGFTLIETLIYMAIATIITMSLMNLAFTLTTTQKNLAETIQDDGVGMYWLRAFDTASHIHEIPAFMNSLADQPFITNVIVATSSTLSSISFTIDDQQFALTTYEQ